MRHRIHRHRSGQDHLSPGCTGRTQQSSRWIEPTAKTATASAQMTRCSI